MPLHLHVFEERYRLMMQRVLSTNQTFGVTLIKRGEEALGPLPEPYMVGCTARVVRVDPLENGEFNLTVIGDERFRILHMGLSEPYMTAYVESTPLMAHHTLDVVRGARVLRARLVRYLALLARFAERDGEDSGLQMNVDLTNLQMPDDPMMLIYLSAALLQIPPSEKQPLLEAETATQLLKHVQRMYRRELAILPPQLEISDEESKIAAMMN